MLSMVSMLMIEQMLMLLIRDWVLMLLARMLMVTQMFKAGVLIGKTLMLISIMVMEVGMLMLIARMLLGC